jgi:hypothetical protein
LEPDGFLFPIGMNFRDKGRSKGGLAEFVELIVDEAEQNAALADSAVPNHYDFDLR